MSFAFGSTLATAKLPRSALEVFFTLATPALKSGIAVLLDGALCDDLAILQPQYGYGDMLASVIVDAGHSHLLCNYT